MKFKRKIKRIISQFHSRFPFVSKDERGEQEDLGKQHQYRQRDSYCEIVIPLGEAGDLMIDFPIQKDE